MRVLLQRVKWARVSVGGRIVGDIDGGVVGLVGVGVNDDESCVSVMAKKVANLRIFEDTEEKMNLSLLDVDGACLVISQFTLYSDCTKGRRPYFGHVANPLRASELCELFARDLASLGVMVATGEFGARMDVELCNDGPVTIWLDSADFMR